MTEIPKLNRRILVIDDEIDMGETICSHLKEKYEEVEFFSDPNLAKKALLSQSYSIILSDVNMPQLLGPELVRFFRSQGILSPVIFLTGYANKENILAALRLGVADVLEKPFPLGDLEHSIERVLEMEKRKAQLVLDMADESTTPEKILQKKKMLGLFHLAADKRRIG